MIFLNPWLLVGLPVAIIPLLLHLWMSRRIRVVELSTFRFLFDSYVQQRRRLRFLEALVATLRTLFLLLLVLVVARPIVKHWSSLFGADAGRDIILMVDCSASMKANTDGVASIERAKTAARAIAERMNRADRLTLIRVGGEPEELFSRFSVDTEKMGQQIDRLEADSAHGNLFNALKLISNRDDDRARNAVVYFLTDCQVSEWRELRDQDLRFVRDCARKKRRLRRSRHSQGKGLQPLVQHCFTTNSKYISDSRPSRALPRCCPRGAVLWWWMSVRAARARITRSSETGQPTLGPSSACRLSCARAWPITRPRR